MFPDLYLSPNCGTTLVGGIYGQERYSSIRRAMETHRAVVAEDAAQPTWRSSLDRQPSGSRWHLVGAQIRRPLAGPARRISKPLDVLASTQTLVRRWDVAAHLASIL